MQLLVESRNSTNNCCLKWGDYNPSGIDSPGDANAPLNYNKPNYVVTKGRVGVTELVGGIIRVRMVKGKMTRKVRRALQKNINKQQKNYGN